VDAQAVARLALERLEPSCLLRRTDTRVNSVPALQQLLDEFETDTAAGPCDDVAHALH
jgi:hypothetical protein